MTDHPTTITIADLHAAGAEVSGHAEAWEHLIAEQGAEGVMYELALAVERQTDPDARPTPMDLRRQMGCLTIPDEPHCAPRILAITTDSVLSAILQAGGSISSRDLQRSIGAVDRRSQKRLHHIMSALHKSKHVDGSGGSHNRVYTVISPATQFCARTPVTNTEKTAPLHEIRSILAAHQAAVAARLDDIASTIISRAYDAVGLEHA